MMKFKNNFKMKELPPDFAHVLHERSRSSADERRKLLVALASGALAVYFVTLTSKVEPALSATSKSLAFWSTFFMAMATLFGIMAIHADARRSYYWACALSCVEEEGAIALKTLRDKWIRIKETSDLALYACFFFGILTSSAYVVMRIDS